MFLIFSIICFRDTFDQVHSLSGFIITNLFTKHNYKSYLFHQSVAIFLILEVQHIQ